MDFPDFERRAREAFRRIPDEYREGVDGLKVVREAMPHPTMADIHTLGECRTEFYPSDWVGPETTRSIVVLYHGSFQRLAELDPKFDWEEELWETLTHELRHHLEFLAEDDALEGVDHAMDEEFKRWEGMDFDPWYYQYGDEVADGVYRVEDRFYLEQAWRKEDFRTAREVTFRWHGGRYAIPRPDVLGDVHYVWIHGVDTGRAELELVLLRKRGWWDALKRVFAGEPPEIWESEARAVPAEG